VVLANTGVTSLVAGSGISVSSASGAVTVSNTATAPAYTGYQTYQFVAGQSNIIPVTGNCGRINLGVPGTPGSSLFANNFGGSGWALRFPLTLTNPSFNANSRVVVTSFSDANVVTGDPLNFTISFYAYNAGGTYATSVSGIPVGITGPGPIPSNTLLSTQYSFDFFVVQLEP
jgi:hypothetical protein